MAATGQTINDRLNAVRYALVGQGLARTVCKATTLEVVGPKKKHIDYLLACTNEPNISIPQLANLLIERTQHTNWAVVFKAMISIHHLMSFGNERFSQYMATSNHSFELSEFMDRTTPQGYSMSTFVRRYAKYINDKTISYRTLAIDLCKIRSGNDNALRTMNMDNLSKTLPIVQTQFDSLLSFCAEPKDLNNGVIMAAFKLLYKDLVKLYVAYQEAIINLLERYFKLSRKKTREALELYKGYLSRMDQVANFLGVVEAVELDKSEMPDLTKSPGSILKLLEQHLAQLEAKKRGVVNAGQTDNEEVDNKENEERSGFTEKNQTTDEDTEKKSTENPGNGAGPSSVPGTGVDSSKKQLPPQKPARPSPKTSPRSSQGSTAAKATTGDPAKSTKNVPPAHPAPPEKKAPPERPAKPPSRPPPPSAAHSALPSFTSPAPTGNESGPQNASEKDEPKDRSQAKPTAACTSPPLHPPPPSNVRRVSNSASTTVEPATNAEPPSTRPETSSGTERAPDNPHHETSTCSGLVNDEVSQIEDNSNEPETNHVNNVAEEGDENDFLPPPPPIMGDDDPQEAEVQEERTNTEEASPADPIDNGRDASS